MFDENKLLEIAAFVKWQRDEEMSRHDLERLISVFQEHELRVASIDAPGVGALQARLRSVLAERFGLAARPS